MQDACKGCLQASTKFAGDPFRRFVRDFEGVADRLYRSIAISVTWWVPHADTATGSALRTCPSRPACALRFCAVSSMTKRLSAKAPLCKALLLVALLCGTVSAKIGLGHSRDSAVRRRFDRTHLTQRRFVTPRCLVGTGITGDVASGSF